MDSTSHHGAIQKEEKVCTGYMDNRWHIDVRTTSFNSDGFGVIDNISIVYGIG